jgi:hypothetical protein
MNEAWKMILLQISYAVVEQQLKKCYPDKLVLGCFLKIHCAIRLGCVVIRRRPSLRVAIRRCPSPNGSTRFRKSVEKCPKRLYFNS